MSFRKPLLLASACAFGAVFAGAPAAHAAGATTGAVAPADLSWDGRQEDAVPTATPIKHLVIVYNESVSFDHYFATYPSATNPPGEPPFTGNVTTPTVNNLASAGLLTGNPNDIASGNGTNAANPFRLDRSQAATSDQGASYTQEQEAYDGGKADLFPEFTGNGTPGGTGAVGTSGGTGAVGTSGGTGAFSTAGGTGAFSTKGQVMGYYDGNTVTAIWNYAQHYAMSDNAFTDTYGPSTPGALEAVAGQTDGLQIVTNTANKTSNYLNDTQGGLTLINDIDPAYDSCSSTTDNGMINARNIGDLLNAARLTWGGFMGGFNLNATNPNGTTGCARSTVSATVGATVSDYIPHHNWFQYFASTANPAHARPAGLVDIGYSFDHSGAADPANHEYDLTDFYAAVKAGNFPSVAYIKLPAYQDGHAGYSDPLDEQAGLVKLVNFIQAQPDWASTAIIVTYDDSDGWYDHAFAAPAHSSADATADQLSGAGHCGTGAPPDGINGGPVNGRCGPGTRIPFLVISPWAKDDYVDHGLITQASILRFIEDNWLGGERLGGGSFDAATGSIMPLFDFTGAGTNKALYLDPATGETR